MFFTMTDGFNNIKKNTHTHHGSWTNMYSVQEVLALCWRITLLVNSRSLSTSFQGKETTVLPSSSCSTLLLCCCKYTKLATLENARGWWCNRFWWISLPERLWAWLLSLCLALSLSLSLYFCLAPPLCVIEIFLCTDSRLEYPKFATEMPEDNAKDFDGSDEVLCQEDCELGNSMCWALSL